MIYLYHNKPSKDHVTLHILHEFDSRLFDSKSTTSTFEKQTGRNPSLNHVAETPKSPPTAPSKDCDAMQP